MAKRRKASPLVVYNLLLREVTTANKLLSEDKKLSLAERRVFIKEKLWKTFGKMPRYRIRLWEVREAIHRKLKRVPKKFGCDVTLLDPSQYTAIDYYELDDRLRSVIPNCIYTKVRAGQFGSTNIFNTRDYNYEKSGLGQITRSINDYVDRLPTSRRKSAYIVYNGMVVLRPKKPNDGTPENYYLEFNLYINDKAIASIGKAAEVPRKFKRKKKTKSEVTRAKLRQYVNSRLKKLRTAKSVFKRMRVAIAKSVFEVRGLYKKPKRFYDAKEKKRLKDETMRTLTNMVNRNLKNGKISKKQSDNFKKHIKNAFKEFAQKDKKPKGKNRKGKG